MNIWDKKFYAKKEIYRRKTFKRPHKEISKFIKLLKKIKANNVLDLGCGTGRHLIVLAKSGFSVYGQDISKKALKLARERLKKEGLKAELIIGNIYKKLPYRDNFFDGIISTNALHHGKSYQIKNLIKEIERIMKRDAVLMIEVPRMGKKYRRAKYKEIEAGVFVPVEGPEEGIVHYVFSSKSELKKFFSKFKVIDIHCRKKEKFQTISSHYTMFARLK